MTTRGGGRPAPASLATCAQSPPPETAQSQPARRPPGALSPALPPPFATSAPSGSCPACRGCTWCHRAARAGGRARERNVGFAGGPTLPGPLCSVPLRPSFGTEAASEALRWSPRSHRGTSPRPVCSPTSLTSQVSPAPPPEGTVCKILRVCPHRRGERCDLGGRATQHVYSRPHGSGPGVSMPAAGPARRGGRSALLSGARKHPVPRVLLRTCRPSKCRKITEDRPASRSSVSTPQPCALSPGGSQLPVPQGAQSQNAAAALTSVHIRVPAARSALAAACPGEERYFGI